MEDRYLFKAKRLDNGEWVEGSLVQTVAGSYIVVPYKHETILGEGSVIEIDPSTICQCTGLRDKTGKLIWENDVVNLKNGKGVVIWDKAEWRIKWIKDTIWRKDLHFWVNEDDWKCEVIGNIFDNPELLEVGE